jgi:hypothetical protein
MIGVIVCIFSVGATLNGMNRAYEQFQRMPKPVALSLAALPDGVQSKGNFTRDSVPLSSHNADDHTKQQLGGTRQYILLNAIGSSTLDDGKYLYNPASGQIEVQWIQGIGSERAAAPQGRLMATVINGILSRKLPWTLVLLGVALVIVVELLGVRSLTFAVGAYLSIATTLAIFVGGLMRWMVDRAMIQHRARARVEANPDVIDPETGLPIPGSVTPDLDSESEISPGSLYASGLIAAGGIVGLLGVSARLLEGLSEQHGGHWQLFRFSEGNPLHHDWVSVVMFALLAFSLYYFARKPLDGQKQG